MPDWDKDELKQLKKTIIKYIKSINEKDYVVMNEVFSENIVINKGEEFNIKGKEKVIKWFRDTIEKNNIQFELIDASTGMFSSEEAVVMLWIHIYDGNNKKKIDEYVESTLFRIVDNQWKICRCFGIGFSPELHKKYFDRFLSYSIE